MKLKKKKKDIVGAIIILFTFYIFVTKPNRKERMII